MKFLLSLLLVTTSFNLSAKTIQSHPIEELFVIKKGFDTNDNIELTFLSLLPNACFKPYKLNIKRNKNVFKLNFTIREKNLSGCNNNLIEPSFPVKYSQTFSLGELVAGQYKIEYKNKNKIITKTFSVAQANSVSIDDQLYAPVSNAFIPELIEPTDSAQIILTGIFQHNCLLLDEESIQVVRQNNVFIVLPIARRMKSTKCYQQLRSLESIIDLGSVTKEGHYLIHIRSQSGLSVNKVFQVKRDKFDPRGL